MRLILAQKIFSEHPRVGYGKGGWAEGLGAGEGTGEVATGPTKRARGFQAKAAIAGNMPFNRYFSDLFVIRI